MNRRQLAFIILFNAIVSLVIALLVVWAVEARRPDPEELAISYTPPPLIVTQAPVADATATVAVEATAPAVEPTSEATRDFGATETYVVQTGDSLSSIADRFRIPIADLVELNNLPNPDFVFVGQRLQIPGGDGVAESTENASDATAAPVTSGILLTALEAPGDLSAEALQITNDSDQVVNLNGWTVGLDDGPSYTFGAGSLFPGGYIWLHTTSGENTSIARYWNRDAPAWTSGSTVRLRNPQATEVATLTVP